MTRMNLARAMATVSLAALSVAGLAIPAHAQENTEARSTVAGRVTDATGRVNIGGAVVRIPALGLETRTGADGRFLFTSVPAGDYEITVSYLNAGDSSQTVSVTGGQPLDLALSLADTAVAETGTGSEIIVTGTRGSLGLARSQELASDQFKTIVSADAIGNFADQNVAESLQRLPGVSIRRSEGEGQQVAVRGLSGSFVTVTVDGAKLGSRDLDSRSVNLDVVSSDLLNGIEVTKTLTPDLDADAIAGSINLRTLSAFDRNQDSVSVRGELAIQEKSSDVNEKVSGDFTKLFGAGETWGIAGSISYQNRKSVVDEYSVDDGLRELAPGILSPRRFNLRNDPAERIRLSGNLNLEFRPDEENSFFVRGTYARFKDDDIRARTRVEFDDATGANILALSEDSIRVQRVDVEKRFRFTDQEDELYAISAGGENVFGPFTLTYQADYSRNQSDQPSVEPRFRERDVTATYDNLGIDGADFDIFANPARRSDPFNPANFERRFITQYDRFIDDEVMAFKADLQRDMDLFGRAGSIKIGAKYQRRQRSVDQDRFDIDIDDDAYDVDGDGIVTIADFNPAVPQDTDLNTGFFPNLSLVRSFAREAALAGRAAGDFTELFAENNGFDYSVEEDVLSGYLMSKFNPTDTIQVIAGVRVEATKWRTEGNDTNIISYDEDISEALADALDAALAAGTATFTRAQADAFLADRFDADGDPLEELANVTAVSDRNSYVDFFPSVNVRWDIANTLLARLSYTTATRRPDFNQASAIFTTSTSEETDEDDIPAVINDLATARNIVLFERNVSDLRDPQLDPLTAHQFDASLAWYPNRNTFFQVAGYYKRISNFILPIVFSGSDLSQIGVPVGEVVSSDGARTRTVTGGFNSVETFINGDRATIYGVELSGQQNFTFLPGLLSGLFVSGNVTLSESKATDAQIGRTFTLPDQSNLTYNVSAGIENDSFSLRWSGNYTGKRLIAINAGFLGLEDERSDLLERSRFTMDVNLRINVREGFQVYFDALNINDAEDRNYFRGDPSGVGGIFNLIENYGPTYQAGVRLQF